MHHSCRGLANAIAAEDAQHIVKQIPGTTDFSVGFLSAIPWVCAVVAMYFAAKWQDKAKSKRPLLVVALLVAAVGTLAAGGGARRFGSPAGSSDPGDVLPYVHPTLNGLGWCYQPTAVATLFAASEAPAAATMRAAVR